MYILNATAFSADWEDEFLTANTHEKRCTNIDGSTSAVQMMNGSADCYMENENCTGFAKMYKGENYYFAALLPNGDISKFVKGLGTKDGAEEVMGLLKSKEYRFTSVTVPKDVYKRQHFLKRLEEHLRAAHGRGVFADAYGILKGQRI